MKAQFWSFDVIFAMAIFSSALMLISFVWLGVSGQFSLSYSLGSQIMQAQVQSLQSRILTPGTPSKHLFDEAATASNGTARASSGRAPKALIASINRRRPARATTAAISATGWRTPEVVSHCTTATWVTAGSAASPCRSAATMLFGNSWSC